jgi:hypothetical protein
VGWSRGTRLFAAQPPWHGENKKAPLAQERGFPHATGCRAIGLGSDPVGPQGTTLAQSMLNQVGRVAMSDTWHDKASRLLGMAMQARRDGNDALADILIEAGKRANRFAEHLRQHPPRRSGASEQPILQQQQIQPKNND